MSWQRPPTAKSPYASTAKLPTAKPSGSALSEIDKQYDRAPWRKFKAQCLALNPRCQRLVNGQQCTEQSRICHHLVSPYADRGQFLSWWNIVCVCAEHHPPGQGAGPHERYSTTRGMFDAVVEPNETIVKLHGGVINMPSK